MEPAQSSQAKLGRGRYHLDTLQAEIATLFKEHPYAVYLKKDASRRQYIFRVRGLAPPKDEWSLLVGDCLNNLRSALDHLVFEMAIIHQRRGLTDDEAASCSFPLFDYGKEALFKTKGLKSIALLGGGEQTRIRELQPFNAAEPSIWGDRIPAHLPQALKQLHRLNNWDKHRQLHVLWQSAQPFPLRPPPFPGVMTEITLLPLKDHAEIGKWLCPDPMPELPDDMDVYGYFSVGVALDETALMNDAQRQLTYMAQAVEAVLGMFRPCLSHGGPPLPLTDLQTSTG